MMRSIGSYPTDDDLDEMIGVFDRDSDGLINFVEVRTCTAIAAGMCASSLPKLSISRGIAAPLTLCCIFDCHHVCMPISQFCALMTRRMEANEDEGVDEMVRMAARKVAAQLKK